MSKDMSTAPVLVAAATRCGLQSKAGRQAGGWAMSTALALQQRQGDNERATQGLAGAGKGQCAVGKRFTPVIWWGALLGDTPWESSSTQAQSCPRAPHTLPSIPLTLLGAPPGDTPWESSSAQAQSCTQAPQSAPCRQWQDRGPAPGGPPMQGTQAERVD